MDTQTNYIVKARPGVLGGKHEEKRPLRQLASLPVKRHVFINRDSHPDADIYVAIHEAKDLPSPVPDYQVPHCHNTDEFYYFIGNNPDLTGFGRANHFRRQSAQDYLTRLHLYSHRRGS